MVRKLEPVKPESVDLARFDLLRTLQAMGKETRVQHIQILKEDPDAAAELNDVTTEFNGSTDPAEVYFISDSADDGASGTGARSAVVWGIDENNDLIWETIVPTGTTIGKTVAKFKRHGAPYVATFGSTKHAVGNLSFGTRGYHETGLASLTAATASGLAALTQYYFKVNIDAGGAVEYDITTAADVTIGAVLALMNTALAAVPASFALKGGDIRCTSLGSLGSTSKIALTAGTTGVDLFATLTGFAAFDTAVDGVTTATIAANDTESHGARTYIPTGWNAAIAWVSAEIIQASGAAASALTLGAEFWPVYDDRIWEEDLNLKYTNIPVQNPIKNPPLRVFPGVAAGALLKWLHQTVNTGANSTSSYQIAIILWRS